MRRLIGALAIALVGCGSEAETCQPPPSMCTSAAPSYKGEIAAIIAEKCAGCHAAGGVSSSWPLTTYGDVYNQAIEAQAEVGACLMPQLDAGQLTDTERTALLQWLVCGAPDN